MRGMSLSAMALAAVCYGSSLPATAGTMTRINAGATATIDAHGTCRKVTNSNGEAAMVPHSTASEWVNGANAFLAGNRPGLAVSACSLTFDQGSSNYMRCEASPDPMPCVSGAQAYSSSLIDSGTPVTTVAAADVFAQGLTFTWGATAAQVQAELNAICGNTALVSGPGVYRTLRWNGSGADDHAVAAVYECN